LQDVQRNLMHVLDVQSSSSLQSSPLQ
jgi:hypothetical protein